MKTNKNLPRFETDFTIRKRATYEAIYDEWTHLIQNPANSRVKIKDYLCKKYHYTTHRTVERIIIIERNRRAAEATANV